MSFIKKLLNEYAPTESLLGGEKKRGGGAAGLVRSALLAKFGGRLALDRPIRRASRVTRRPSGRSRSTDRPSGASRPRATTPTPAAKSPKPLTAKEKQEKKLQDYSDAAERGRRKPRTKVQGIGWGGPDADKAEALKKALTDSYQNLAFIFLDVINEDSVDLGKHPKLLKKALEGPDDPTPKKSLLARLVSRFLPKRKAPKAQEK